MNLISGILIAGVLTMSGCSSIKQLDIFTMEVERQPLDLEKPTIQLVVYGQGIQLCEWRI